MQFQVPQFLDTEDKVIGPLTVKQFSYILVAAVIGLILFKLFNLFVFIILMIPIAAITFALGFVKIHNRPFIELIKNFFGFLKKPDYYIWKKPETIDPTEEKKIPKLIKKEAPEKKRVSKKRLQEINWRIDIEKII
ncbi:PrgI family protein [Patescibacteria group bacterium]|nr:PrgI family protein [Patescibacteria group bacterium]